MTISEIKNRTQKTSPYFFSKSTLSFFGQTMRSFKQSKQVDGRTKIFAPMKDYTGRNMGQTVRYFNPETNELDRA